MDSFVSKQSKFEFQKYLIYKEFLFLQTVLFRYFPNEYIKIRFNTPKEYSPLLFSENPLINEIISDMKRFIIQAKKNVKNRERNISKIKENLLGDKLSERRKSQLGSLFTRWIIPVLYEYLRPFYKSTAHHHFSFLPSDRNRSNAYCPYELSKDISDILRYQYPEFKRKLTPRNVKSAVHRYIDLEDENHKNRIKNIYEPDDKYRVMLPRDIKKVLNSLETKKEVF